MPHVTNVNVFEVEQIAVRWEDEGQHYVIVIEGADAPFGAIEINCWRGHGKAALPPALVVERAPEPPAEDKPMDPPNAELDI